MRATIDKAGRLVIPASIRDRAGLTPGTTLEITVDDSASGSSRSPRGRGWSKSGRRTVARPTSDVNTRPALDIAALVEDERNRWP